MAENTHKFVVTITRREKLEHDFTVEASRTSEAIKKAEEASLDHDWGDSDYVSGYDEPTQAKCLD